MILLFFLMYWELLAGKRNETAERNLLTDEEADAIDREKILRLTASPLADRIRQSPKVYREVPFVMRYELSSARGEEVLVHGIIDCFFEEDGEIVLVDYKSDYIRGSAEEWARTHAVQMDIYKKAVTEATALNVKETWLYSFYYNKAIPL